MLKIVNLSKAPALQFIKCSLTARNGIPKKDSHAFAFGRNDSEHFRAVDSTYSLKFIVVDDQSADLEILEHGEILHRARDQMITYHQ